MWCQGELCGVRGSYVVSGGVRWGQEELCGHLDMGRPDGGAGGDGESPLEMALMQVQVAHQGGGTWPPLVLPPPLPRQAQHVAVGVELPDVPLLGRGHRVAARARPHLEHGA